MQAEGAVPSTPSPVLFSSSDDQAVPLGEEECEEAIGCPGQGRAGGEGAKDKPRGFAAEEPGGWMDSTMASLGDEGDQCIMVGRLCPPTAFTVQIEVQGTPLEASLQAGDGARLKGFIAGPFDVKAGQNVHQVDLYVAPLKDSMLLGKDFLRDHRAKLNLDAGTLCLGSETLCMTWDRSLVLREARVTLIRKVKVPEGSAVLCPVV